MIHSLARYFFIKSAAKSDLIKKKYPDHIKLIDRLEKEDPSPTKKYLEWMLKQIIFSKNDENITYNTDSVIFNIKYFHKNINSFDKTMRDINTYDNESLGEAIRDIEFNKKSIESETIENTGRFLLIRPDNKNACMKYAADTKLCITSNHMEQYDIYTSSNNMIFYFIIDKEAVRRSPMSKICYSFKRNDNNSIKEQTIWDSQNNIISENDVKSYMGEYYDDIIVKMHNDLSTRPMNDAHKDMLLLKNMTLDKYKYYAEMLTKKYSGNDVLLDSIFLIVDNFEESLALNPSISNDDQLILTKSNEKYVRAFLAKNPNISEETQLILAKDNEGVVRRNLSKNPNLSDSARKILQENVVRD